MGLYILGLALAAIFIFHAIPKLKSPAGIAKALKWPKWAPQVLGGVEVVSSLMLIFSLWEKVAAGALAIVMLGALYYNIVVWKNAFSGSDKMGWEFDLVLFASALAIMLG